MTDTATPALNGHVIEGQEATGEFVTAVIRGQLCGIPVLKVHDVLRRQKITPIPLAPQEVEGSLNLRGRIVTSINLRARMGLPPNDVEHEGISIVVEHLGELYSLTVDGMGEVMKVSRDAFERSPATLDPLWRSFSQGVYRLEKGLLIILDIDSLLDFSGQQTAAWDGAKLRPV